MNVKQLHDSELATAATQISDELSKACVAYHTTNERIVHLQDMLYLVQTERLDRRNDPWMNEDTAVELTEADLAIAYEYASSFEAYISGC